jgi:hypothetical protein
MAQTGSNFENFNFFVVFSAYRVQKSIMSNLSHTNVGVPLNLPVIESINGVDLFNCCHFHLKLMVFN